MYLFSSFSFHYHTNETYITVECMFRTYDDMKCCLVSIVFCFYFFGSALGGGTSSSSISWRCRAGKDNDVMRKFSIVARHSSGTETEAGALCIMERFFLGAEYTLKEMQSSMRRGNGWVIMMQVLMENWRNKKLGGKACRKFLQYDAYYRGVQQACTQNNVSQQGNLLMVVVAF